MKVFSPSILGKNHVTYMDNNYFTSVPLFEDLKENTKIYSCGTVHPNRLTGATEIVDKERFEDHESRRVYFTIKKIYCSNSLER